jgi:hypothetical protein
VAVVHEGQAAVLERVAALVGHVGPRGRRAHLQSPDGSQGQSQQ